MNEIIIQERSIYSYYVSFLEGLKDIFDEREQRAAWVHGDYSQYDCFDEIYMGFADPCEDVLQWPSLSEEQRTNLQKLYDMLENYEEKDTDKEIYYDPKWGKIRVFAEQVYEQLKHFKYVPEEDGE